jgi:hypothetical protein
VGVWEYSGTPVTQSPTGQRSSSHVTEVVASVRLGQQLIVGVKSISKVELAHSHLVVLSEMRFSLRIICVVV